MESGFIETASGLISQQRLLEARVVLERAVTRRSASWSPVLEIGDEEIAFSWGPSEFRAYVDHRRCSGVTKEIKWILASFSQAHFLLGWIKLEMGQSVPALYSIERGLALEPDHPRLLSEKGHILQRMQRHGEALRYFQRAETARPWAPKEQLAAALRGEGINLIDLGRVSEAREALMRSLELEPENRSATHELQYIEDNIAELEQRLATLAFEEEQETFQQYAICCCPTGGTFIELDRLMRFHTPRAAAERVTQLKQQELTVVVRVDKLGLFLGKHLEEAPVFDGVTRAAFDKWSKGHALWDLSRFRNLFVPPLAGPRSRSDGGGGARRRNVLPAETSKDGSV